MMTDRLNFRTNRNLYCFLLIFLCFTLTSAGWISWNYHLMTMLPTVTVDIISMIASYLLQAAGIGLFALLRRRIRITSVMFTGVLALYFLFLIPAMLSSFPAASVAFGLLMNLLCGFIAAMYLYPLARETARERRGLVFGGGYAASTIAVWIFSLVGEKSFLSSVYILAIYLVITILTALLIHFGYQENPEPQQGRAPYIEASGTAAAAGKTDRTGTAAAARAVGASAAAIPLPRMLILSGGILIILLSMVKNVGFSFPSSDIVSGLNLELSRIFYGTGLLIAGIINDRNRRFGSVCTMAALIMPFISLALSGQPIPGMVFWALDYFFFGFFSVFRVLFFADLAEENGRAELAGFGLLFGRIGDVMGTALCIAWAGQTVLLIVIASVLFFVTVVVFFRLYLRLHDTAPSEKPSEQERFEQFAASYQLSSREKEVLRFLLEEKSNSEIAASLYVSESTVKFHIHNMLKKTGCRNRAELKNSYNARFFV